MDSVLEACAAYPRYGEAQRAAVYWSLRLQFDSIRANPAALRLVTAIVLERQGQALARCQPGALRHLDSSLAQDLMLFWGNQALTVLVPLLHSPDLATRQTALRCLIWIVPGSLCAAWQMLGAVRLGWRFTRIASEVIIAQRLGVFEGRLVRQVRREPMLDHWKALGRTGGAQAAGYFREQLETLPADDPTLMQLAMVLGYLAERSVPDAADALFAPLLYDRLPGRVEAVLFALDMLDAHKLGLGAGQGQAILARIAQVAGYGSRLPNWAKASRIAHRLLRHWLDQGDHWTPDEQALFKRNL